MYETQRFNIPIVHMYVNANYLSITVSMLIKYWDFQKKIEFHKYIILTSMHDPSSS